MTPIPESPGQWEPPEELTQLAAREWRASADDNTSIEGRMRRVLRQIGPEILALTPRPSPEPPGLDALPPGLIEQCEAAYWAARDKAKGSECTAAGIRAVIVLARALEEREQGKALRKATAEVLNAWSRYLDQHGVTKRLGDLQVAMAKLALAFTEQVVIHAGSGS